MKMKSRYMLISKPSNPKKASFPKVAFIPGDVNSVTLVRSKAQLDSLAESDGYVLGEPAIEGWGELFDLLVGKTETSSYVFSYTILAKAGNSGNYWNIIPGNIRGLDYGAGEMCYVTTGTPSLNAEFIVSPNLDDELEGYQKNCNYLIPSVIIGGNKAYSVGIIYDYLLS